MRSSRATEAHRRITLTRNRVRRTVRRTKTQSQFSSDSTAHIKSISFSMSFSMSRGQSFLLASATAPGTALFKAIDTATELDSTPFGHSLSKTVLSNASMFFGVHQHTYQVLSISIRGPSLSSFVECDERTANAGEWKGGIASDTRHWVERHTCRCLPSDRVSIRRASSLSWR